MSVTTHRRKVAVASMSALALLGVAACGSDDTDSNGDAGPDTAADPADETTDDEEPDTAEPVTLVLQTFGNPGFDPAVEEFQSQNPNITVDHQRMGELRDFAPQLSQWIAAGSGAGDVVMMDEGIFLQYVENPDGFLDLFEVGAEELEGAYLDWKWATGLTADGKQIGLGTDVGGLAMCYRADMFEEAGLPSDRDEVSALWPTWNDYLETGREFMESDVDAVWLDTATGIVQPYVMQNSDVFFYNEDGEFIGDENPVFQEAWDFGLQMAEEGMTAGRQTFTDEWTAAFQASEFATRPCPSWMTGIIEERAGEEHAGAWDIAAIPGGSGNWGGSYLGVPQQTEHPEEAYELAKFITSPEGHLLAFEEVGSMPSTLEALEDPRFTDLTNPYFRDARVGEIMAETVVDLEPTFLGALHQPTWEGIFELAMLRVEAGDQSSDDAFEQAVSEAEALVE